MSDPEICARHYATGEPVRVSWRQGIITRIEVAPALAELDVWLAPTLVDLQVNGFAGVDFQRDHLTVEQLLAATRALRAAGCTRFLLTLVTDEWPKLTARLRCLRRLRSASGELQHAIAGWHIEGPFLSGEPGFHGAHNPALMLDPAPEHIGELRAIADTDPLLLTMAPERKGALEAIARAKSLGVKVSLGHTNASADILQRAVAAASRQRLPATTGPARQHSLARPRYAGAHHQPDSRSNSCLPGPVSVGPSRPEPRSDLLHHRCDGCRRRAAGPLHSRRSGSRSRRRTDRPPAEPKQLRRFRAQAHRRRNARLANARVRLEKGVGQLLSLPLGIHGHPPWPNHEWPGRLLPGAGRRRGSIAIAEGFRPRRIPG